MDPREEWVQIPVPAIISEDTFEAVQKAAHDSSIFSSRRTEPDTFLLRRLVRCGHCGVKLAAHRANRHYRIARDYLCPQHDPVRAGGQDRRCPERRVRADELDNFVLDQVRQLLARPELLSAGEAALAAQAPVPDDELLAAQLARLERRRDAAQAERRRLAHLYQVGVIEHAEMTRRAAELDARRRQLDEELDTLVARRAQLSQASSGTTEGDRDADPLVSGAPALARRGPSAGRSSRDRLGAVVVRPTLVSLVAQDPGHSGSGPDGVACRCGDAVGVEATADLADRVPAGHIIVENTAHNNGFWFEDLKVCRFPFASRHPPITIRGLPGDHLAAAGPPQFASAVTLGHLGLFVLGDNALYLGEEPGLGVVVEGRRVAEHHPHTEAGDLVEHEHLVDVGAGQAVRR